MKKDNKKGFQGGVFVFLIAAILVILTLHNFTDSKSAKVSFSHQVEHLVNLDLLSQDNSVKTALNDNLVTFSGKFKQTLETESDNRHRYLELLNQNHKLASKKIELLGQISVLRQQVIDAANYAVDLSGLSIPKEGLAIVGSSYNLPEFDASLSLYKVNRLGGPSLKEVELLFAKTSANLTEANVAELGGQVEMLLKGFLSPVLGLGDQALKEKVQGLEERFSGSNVKMLPIEKLGLYKSVISELQEVMTALFQPQDGVRFSQLRMLRAYIEDLNQFSVVVSRFETNEAELAKARESVSNVIWFFNNKELTTKSLERQDPETYEQWFAQAQEEWKNFDTNKSLSFKAPDQPRNIALDKTFKSQEIAPNYISYILFTILPIVSVVLLLYFVFARQMKGAGSSAMNFGKSPARMLVKNAMQITFKDVAGVDEAKEELEEIVDFLKDPTRFTALGARIPRGVLCVGPPGTGKTLIAKAVAGEADRPFFSISGSDFVEMFVGVGASRIRDLFDQAKKHAPCIIFIDEIDAVGRHRGIGMGGGHDEREQTLNQLLVEMDGMSTNEGVILMAATNRPDVLDKALLRPGRFDRRVVLDLPDIRGRHEILKVHARKIKLDPAVDLLTIAKLTPGSSGADLMNVLNEAALMAARKGRRAVTQEDALAACDKVRFGKERKSMQLDDAEKKTTAYHESGHAVVALVVKNADRIEKVTIIPRGLSLGATYFVPKQNRVSYWRKELLDQLAVLMGGRVAEELFIGDVCSGAQMDIAQATKLARAMVCEWGMTDALGMVAYDERTDQNQYLMPGASERSYSPETSKKIDEEVKKLIDEAYLLATSILKKHEKEVQLMADMLMEFETLDKADLDHMMAGTWSKEDKQKRIDALADAQKGQVPPPHDHLPDQGITPSPA
jgi:cell division protease FtsH